jgi:hypothetical protein
MASLNYDCVLELTNHLDCRSVLVLTQVSHFYSRVCNDDRVWSPRVHARTGRELDKPKFYFRRSLRAGMLKCYGDTALPDRRDIVKASMDTTHDRCYLACITVDDRCLVSTPLRSRPEMRDIPSGKLTCSVRDVGQAEDALVHGDVVRG